MKFDNCCSILSVLSVGCHPVGLFSGSYPRFGAGSFNFFPLLLLAANGPNKLGCRVIAFLGITICMSKLIINSNLILWVYGAYKIICLKIIIKMAFFTDHRLNDDFNSIKLSCYVLLFSLVNIRGNSCPAWYCSMDLPSLNNFLRGVR